MGACRQGRKGEVTHDLQCYYFRPPLSVVLILNVFSLKESPTFSLLYFICIYLYYIMTSLIIFNTQMGFVTL